MFLEVTKLGRGYQNIKRYRHIASVLIRHGFYDFVDHSNLIRYVSLRRRLLFGGKYRQPAAELKLSHWQRLRLVLEDLGPAFVKLGQFLSNRPDILPQELCDELGNLLDAVPPFPADEVTALVELELGAPLGTLFAEFDPVSHSSASIAQVHVAKLHSGEKVAVKVQRPHIRSVINSDLDTMRHIAHLMEKYVEGVSALNPVEIVDEFKLEINNELDFGNELVNIDKFRSLFKDDPAIVIPMTYKRLCSRRVLTMEFIEGVKLSHTFVRDDAGFDTALVVDRIADMLLKQFFELGYFHADPHPGNILVSSDNRICLLDFGLVGVLSPRHKEGLCEIITGIVKRDPRIVTAAVLKLSLTKDVPNRELLEYQVFKVVERYAYLPLEELSMGDFFRDLLRLIIANKLKISMDIYLLLKAIITLEATVMKIQPTFDMISHVKPFVEKMLSDRLSPLHLTEEFFKSAGEYARLLYSLPEQFSDILEQVKNRNIRIKFEHAGLEPMLKTHDQISNRLSFSIVTGCMLIASSIIIHADLPPTIYGIPAFGGVLLLCSTLLGGLLLLSILRHGRF